MAGDQKSPLDLSVLENALPKKTEPRKPKPIAPGENFDRFFHIPVAISGEDANLQKIISFKEADFGEKLLRKIQQMGYERPMPIQQNSIPYIEAGRDVMGHSPTGTGKTAAYILPLLDKLSKKEDANLGAEIIPALGKAVLPRGLVLLPTRELAIQVHKEFVKFARELGLKIGLVYGGKPDGWDQMQAIRRGCDILVATPGRLLGFLRRDGVSLVKCKYLILDEADKMLDEDDPGVRGYRWDKKFGEVIKAIVERGQMVPKSTRQTLLFSATFPDVVQKLCRDFLDEPVFISIGSVGAANNDIKQEVIKISQTDKFEKLGSILTEELNPSGADESDQKKIVVFTKTKAEAHSLCRELEKHSFPVVEMQSDMKQEDREESYYDFKKGTRSVLVATSVAGRGLDIEGIDLVINYSLPNRQGLGSEYVQRIGRTGRLGNRGRAISFFDPEVDKEFGQKHLLPILREAHQIIPDWFLHAVGAAHGPRFMDADFYSSGDS